MSSPFSEAISSYLPDLRSYCMQLASGSKWDAEDIEQESLIKIHKALEQSPDRPITKAYLYRIARNTWIDSYRKHTGKPVLLPDAGNDREYHESRFLVRETLELLAAQLTAHQTVLIILIDIFSYTAREAAQLIQSTEGAVKEALKRARKRLKGIRASGEIHGYALPSERNQESRDTLEWMESLIRGFQSANPYAIANAYLSMQSRRIQLQRVQRAGERLLFTFRDPDGHLLTMTTEIFWDPVSYAPSSSV